MDFIEHSRHFSRNARLFLLNNLLSGVGVGLFGLLYNLYLVRLGYQEDFIGRFASLGTVALGLCSIPAGLLSDRIGRRRVLVLASLLIPSALMGQSFCTQASILLGLNLLWGAGQALTFSVISPFLMENSSEEERLYLFSSSLALSPLAGALGSSLGGILPGWTERLGMASGTVQAYRCTLLLGVGLMLVAALPILLIRERLAERVVVEPGGQRNPTNGSGQVWLSIVFFALVAALVGVNGGVIFPFFNVYCAERLGASTAQIGFVYALSQVLMGGAMLLAPSLTRRWGRVLTIAGGHLLTIPAILILAMVPRLDAAAIAYWMRMAGFNMVNPVNSTFTMEVVPSRLRATTSGIVNTTWSLTYSLAAFVAGQTIVRFGYQLTFLGVTAFQIGSPLVYLLYFRRYEGQSGEALLAAVRRP